MRVVGVRFSQDVLPHYACAMDYYLLTSSKYEHGYETREEVGGGCCGVGEGNKECFYILLFRCSYVSPSSYPTLSATDPFYSHLPTTKAL